jgi:hypothetical protein
VAYLAKDDAGGVLVVDGTPRSLGGEIKPNNFMIRDDGVAAAVVGKLAEWSVVLGDQRFGPYNDVCELSFQSASNGRFAFAAMRGPRPLAVVDGKTIEAPGAVIGCDVYFSPDGAHFVYGTIEQQEGKSVYHVVFDGRVEPAEGQPTVVRFEGARVLLSISATNETIYWWPEVPTPPVPPTVDDYRGSGSSGWGARVRIGRSLGPRFDEIDPKGITLAEDGHIHYRGVRQGVPFDVTDNVIDALAKPKLVAPTACDKPGGCLERSEKASPVLVVP